MLSIDPLTKPPNTDLQLPGSKSITNRALVLAALAKGTSTLRRVLFAEDTRAMIDCLKKLGVNIATDEVNEEIVITGCDGQLHSDGGPLWVRQSGTTARFIMPLAALAQTEILINGDPQILKRPHGELFDALKKMGVEISFDGEENHLPARINGAGLHGEKLRVNAEQSSQYISALLLSAPCMPNDTTLILDGNAVSMPYLQMTLSMMNSFGADVEEVDKNQFQIRATGYTAKNYEIEPDASTASYFFATAALSEGRVKVEGLGKTSIQGDIEFVDLLEQMGAEVTRSEQEIEVRGTNVLQGVHASMKNISDTAPTLAVVAPSASTPSSVSGIGFIAYKESDRIAAVITELQKLGIEAEDNGDGFTIQPGTVKPGLVHTYDDHRIAMAFTVLGLVSSGVTLDGPECVTKTAPDFFEYVDQLRLEGDQELAILAIDGPAGSGKTSLAKRIASETGLEYLDTGAMYRSVSAKVIEEGIDPEDKELVVAIANRISIVFEGDEVFVDGERLTETIRSPEVNAVVSYVAANPGVRSILRRAQRSWARKRGGGVLEGRDIGTVVFPRARLKVYVTATPEERAKRRSLESGRPMEEILEEIMGRDKIDSSRIDSPLSISNDALMVDSTGKTIDEVAEEILRSFHV